MPDENQSSNLDKFLKLLTSLGLPFFEIVGELWKFWRKVMRGLSNEGMYEVLDYGTTLEIKDKGGENAFLRKIEKVRYLQDNIIAYQDQAWGDGRILLNYQCTPGIPVDQYRSGYKTHILISLRDVKNKGGCRPVQHRMGDPQWIFIANRILGNRNKSSHETG
jgi:hypothetical protein